MRSLISSRRPAGAGPSAARRLVAGRDVALVYGAVVLVTAAVLASVPSSAADDFVRHCSTNLDNLKTHPPFVLVVSAVVEPSLLDLWIVVPLVWALGAVQRWLGRAAVVVAVVVGHVGATLFVATMLAAGISSGRVPFAAAAATDVGVSYGLAAVLALLTARAAPPWRLWARVLPAVALFAVLRWDHTFTDLGHLAAWVIGLGLSVLVQHAEAVGRRLATSAPSSSAEAAAS